MIISKTFCDICQKECGPQRFGIIAGNVFKMNEQAEVKSMHYEGHVCEDDFLKITDFIEKLRNAQNFSSSALSDESDEKRTDNRAE